MIVSINLEKLRENDVGQILESQLEQILVKIATMTEDGKHITGIISYSPNILELK